MKNNKKIFLLPLAAFILSACGGDGESEDRGNGGDLPDQVSQASLTFPKEWVQNPLLDKEENTFTLRFSTEENKNNNFYISTRKDNPIREIKFTKEHDENLEEYIYNYDQFTQNLEGLGDELLRNGYAQIQFIIDDLPADLYQDSEHMDANRIIKDILKLNIVVNNGVRLSRDISFNYKNENTTPSLPRFFDKSFTFNQSTSNYIVIPIEDPNLNDKITYSVVGDEMFSEMSLSTEQNCEKISPYELINCEITNEDLQAIFKVDTATISDPSVVKNLRFEFTDQSRYISSSQAPNNDDGETPPSGNANFGELNIVSENLNITILNSDDDLTPTVSFSSSNNSISERSGGFISYNVTPAKDRPDAYLDVDYQIELDDLSITSELDRENNRVVFSDINIGQNVDRILRVTVSDGEYSSYAETMVRFNDDVSRVPTLSAPSSVTINESTGGSIKYSTSSDVEGEIYVDGHFISGDYIFDLNHSPESSEFTFSNLQLDGNQIGIFRITAINSSDTVTRDVEVNFNSDINPVLIFPDEINVYESGVNNMVDYTATIENNTQNRMIEFSYEISLPDGVVMDVLSDESVLMFNTEYFSTRKDLSRQMTVSLSDGVSVESKNITVNFINDIDKEMEEFMDVYSGVKSNLSQLLSINADMKILDFYTQVARINGISSLLIEQTINSATEINEYEIGLLNNKRNEIDGLIAEISIDTEDADFEDLNLKLDDLIREKERFGAYIVSDHINSLAELTELNTLGDINNSFSITGVYGRYIGVDGYGSIISGNRFEPSRGYLFLNLVNPNKNICN